MGKKIDFSVYGLTSSLTILIAVLYILSNLNLSSFLIVGVGVAFGMVFGFLTTERKLKSVEKLGEWKVTYKFIIYMIVALTAGGFIIGYLGWLSREYSLIFFTSWLFALGTFQATCALTNLRWEKRNQKLLMYDGFMGGRTYAVPKTDEQMKEIVQS